MRKVPWPRVDDGFPNLVRGFLGVVGVPLCCVSELLSGASERCELVFPTTTTTTTTRCPCPSRLHKSQVTTHIVRSFLATSLASPPMPYPYPHAACDMRLYQTSQFGPGPSCTSPSPSNSTTTTTTTVPPPPVHRSKSPLPARVRSESNFTWHDMSAGPFDSFKMPTSPFPSSVVYPVTLLNLRCPTLSPSPSSSSPPTLLLLDYRASRVSIQPGTEATSDEP